MQMIYWAAECTEKNNFYFPAGYSWGTLGAGNMEGLSDLKHEGNIRRGEEMSGHIDRYLMGTPEEKH